MKYCSHCGNELMDEAVVCPKCGCSVVEKSETNNHAIDIAAKVFLILTLVSVALAVFCSLFTLTRGPEGVAMFVGALIILAYVTPITVYLLKKLKNKERIGVGIKIITLLFVNLIAGILLLCRNED